MTLPLANGSSYGACVSGDDYYDTIGAWTPGFGGSTCTNGNIADKKTFSTIDNTIPQVAVAVNGTDTDVAGRDHAEHLGARLLTRESQPGDVDRRGRDRHSRKVKSLALHRRIAVSVEDDELPARESVCRRRTLKLAYLAAPRRRDRERLTIVGAVRRRKPRHLDGFHRREVSRASARGRDPKRDGTATQRAGVRARVRPEPPGCSARTNAHENLQGHVGLQRGAGRRTPCTRR